MCAIILSIKPNHIENILNGTKQYEKAQFAISFKSNG